jgi:glycosyltransferase involved in cell wall biosynthesis
LVSKTEELNLGSAENANGKPLLSIVIVTNLKRDSIVKTLESLPCEHDVEIVIVTLFENNAKLNNLLQRIELTLKTKIIYDDGIGIYEAMNLGIENCTGDYVVFINDDDQWVLSNYLDLRQTLMMNRNTIILCNFREIGSDRPRVDYKSLKKLNRGSMPTSHQAQIWPLSVLLANHKFRTHLQFRFFGKNMNFRLKIASDLDLFIRASEQYSFLKTNFLISATSHNGFSHLNRGRMYFEVSTVLFSNTRRSLVGAIMLYLSFWFIRMVRRETLK